MIRVVSIIFRGSVNTGSLSELEAGPVCITVMGPIVPGDRVSENKHNNDDKTDMIWYQFYNMK